MECKIQQSISGSCPTCGLLGRGYNCEVHRGNKGRHDGDDKNHKGVERTELILAEVKIDAISVTKFRKKNSTEVEIWGDMIVSKTPILVVVVEVNRVIVMLRI